MIRLRLQGRVKIKLEAQCFLSKKNSLIQSLPQEFRVSKEVQIEFKETLEPKIQMIFIKREMKKVKFLILILYLHLKMEKELEIIVVRSEKRVKS